MKWTFFGLMPSVWACPEGGKDKRIVADFLVAELAKSSGICWRFIGSLGDFRYGFSLTLRHSGFNPAVAKTLGKMLHNVANRG